MSQRSLIHREGTFWPMMAVATPVLVESSLAMLVGQTDLWITGHVLKEARYIAAIGIMSYVMWFIPNIFSAIAIGATALVSRHTGAEDHHQANHFTNQAILVGFCLALGITAVAYFGHGTFFGLIQLNDEITPLATEYLFYIIPIIPLIMLEQVGIACLRGAGDILSGFSIMALVNIINALLSLALATGWAFFPEMGWAGIAIGTAVGHGVGGILTIAILLRGRAQQRLTRPLLRYSKDHIRRLMRVGLPGGIDIGILMTCQFAFVALINHLGTDSTAAHMTAIRIESIAYLPGTAFYIAASNLTGQYLGAKEFAKAKKSALMALWVGGGQMVFAGICFYFAADYLVDFFLGNEGSARTKELAAPLLRIVAYSMPSLALAMIFTGALRGAGDTHWPMIFTSIGFLAIRLPLTLWLAWEEIPVPLTDMTLTGWNIGVAGAWYAMTTDLIIRSILITWRFLHGGWQHTKV
ncbi:MAG: MATE family efflux transporter [Pirellulaceae bacterium]|nr:MATE family efflux transporter [Pirellulaceae bacterium]